jgi:DNA-binding NarL/FixJ family response regulator
MNDTSYVLAIEPYGREECAMATRTQPQTVSVLLADDHRMVREGLRAMIHGRGGMSVQAEADNGRTAVELALEMPIDLVIMDVGMPGLNGIEATRQVLARKPHVKVIALSMHADRRYVAEMLKAGAAGYVLKDAAFEELMTAIRQVLDNHRYLSPGVTGVVLDDYERRLPDATPAGSAFDALTPREREILQLLAEGKAMKEIAHILQVSIKTVETHRRAMMEKLHLYSVAELTKYAIREGLTSLNAVGQN